jgi:hypothetical protein
MLKKGATKEDVEWMVKRLEDRDAIAYDILQYIEIVKTDVHPSQRVALINTYKDLARFQHGDKIKTENVNVNINTTIEEWEKRLMNDNDE